MLMHLLMFDWHVTIMTKTRKWISTCILDLYRPYIRTIDLTVVLNLLSTTVTMSIKYWIRFNQDKITKTKQNEDRVGFVLIATLPNCFTTEHTDDRHTWNVLNRTNVSSFSKYPDCKIRTPPPLPRENKWRVPLYTRQTEMQRDFYCW